MQNYKFMNLIGTVYTKGNLQFSPDGFTVISPVGNRITLYALKDHNSKTLPVEGTTNFTTTSLSPNGFILITGNENGEVHVISLVSETVLHVLKPGGYIRQVKYSPDGSMFAVVKEDVVLIYTAPMKKPVLNPFELKRSIAGVHDIVDVTWSFDSKLVAVSSGRGVIQMYPIQKFKNFKAVTLAVNTEGVIRAFFLPNSYDIYCVDRNGVLRHWETEDFQRFEADIDDFKPKVKQSPFLPRELKDSAETDEKEDSNSIDWIRFKQAKKLYFNELFPKGEKRPPITSVDYNPKCNMLVTGFEGTFFLHDMPDFNLIHTFKISNASISTIALNSSAEWIAFGCPSVGQLIVWEWQSESYIMRQQGHFDIIDCFDYSPDSSVIATGGVDGKIKVWNKNTSFCFKTFGEHTGPITGLVFNQKSKAIISSSMDGTVRAFDLKRYRNFRTLTTPRQVQLGCVAVDSAGALVLAGGLDVFEIYLWCMRTGRLLEVFSGHEGPISSVVFSPSSLSSCFVSASLDKTVRIWQSIESSGVSERIQLESEVTCLAFSPVGNLIAVGCLNANITFFDLEGKDKGSINGGVYLHFATLTSQGTKHNQTNKLRGREFRTLAFSPDGKYLLAAGPNKIICMFNVERQHLTTTYTITKNRSLDGTEGYVNHRQMTEFGNIALLEDRDNTDNKLPLPGVRVGDMASRTYRNEVRVTSVRFAPNGTSWAATTTEGLLIYSSKNFALFDPIGADIHVTPQEVEKALQTSKFDRALMMALQLNMPDLIKRVVGVVNFRTVEILVKDLPFKYVRLLLRFLASELGKESRLELYLKWIEHIMRHHLWLMIHNDDMVPILNELRQSLSLVQKRTVSLVSHNLALSEYILRASRMGEDLDVKIKIEPMDSDEEVEEEQEQGQPTGSTSTNYFSKLYQPQTVPMKCIQTSSTRNDGAGSETSDSESEMEVDNPFKIR